jgi:uncharacterized SAM-binding protein YcdF (DUF218 family)
MSDIVRQRPGGALSGNGRGANGTGEVDVLTRERNSMRGRSILMRTALVGLAGAVLALVAGFFIFVGIVVGATPPADPRAEGIVVLTGGSARIEGALRLLTEGRASRLLISGVNPSVGTAALAGIVDPELQAALACCVDLGHDAQNTIGNAEEARSWAEDRGFGSLIVVTSDYHMPRSLAELSGTMPAIALVAFPVSNPDLRLAEWWRDPGPLALLVREYGKYLVAAARKTLPVSPTPAAAGT